MSVWKINSVTIDTPSEFHIEPKRIKKERRLSSGKLVCDVKAIKDTFTLSYEFLSQTSMAAFVTAYNLNAFVTLTYRRNAAWVTATVWIKSLPQEMLSETPEYWGRTSIIMEEQ